MARVLQRSTTPAIPFAAASDLPPFVPVKLDIMNGLLSQVAQCATSTDEPIGLSQATAAQGRSVAVWDRNNIVKAICGASIAHGADVGVATVAVVSGASGNFNQAQLGPVAAASGARVWRVGKAVEPAFPGETFALYIQPALLSGTP